jgi:hypothetical protein
MIAKSFRVPTAAAAITVFMLSCAASEGSPVTIDVAFEASAFTGFLGTLPPVNFVSGSFTFTYEDVGSPQIIPPDIVNLTIAGFIYDSTTSEVYVDPGLFVFGGSLGGPLSMGAPSNDFRVIIDRPGSARYFNYAVPFSLDIYDASTVRMSVEAHPVPESNSLILIALGSCAWFGTSARRMRSRRH